MKRAVLLMTAVISGLAFSTTSQAGLGKLECEIYERNGDYKKKYRIEAERKLNHTYYYYSQGEILTHYFIRASGMMGGGAHFMQLNVEDMRTGHFSITRGVSDGKLTFGTPKVFVEMTCQVTPDTAEDSVIRD